MKVMSNYEEPITMISMKIVKFYFFSVRLNHVWEWDSYWETIRRKKSLEKRSSICEYELFRPKIKTYLPLPKRFYNLILTGFFYDTCRGVEIAKIVTCTGTSKSTYMLVRYMCKT